MKPFYNPLTMTFALTLLSFYFSNVQASSFNDVAPNLQFLHQEEQVAIDVTLHRSLDTKTSSVPCKNIFDLIQQRENAKKVQSFTAERVKTYKNNTNNELIKIATFSDNHHIRGVITCIDTFTENPDEQNDWIITEHEHSKWTMTQYKEGDIHIDNNNSNCRLTLEEKLHRNNNQMSIISWYEDGMPDADGTLQNQTSNNYVYQKLSQITQQNCNDSK